MATTSQPLVTESPPAFTPHLASVAPRTSRIRSIFGWTGIALLFCVMVELTCRVEDWVTYRMPIFSRYTSLDELVVRDAAGMHGRPNARYEKWTMNALGMRGTDVSPVAPAGTHRIITVGASETFGLRESAGKEYPRQLEDSLNARLTSGECTAPPGTRFEVLNGAFAGMGLPTIEQDVRNRLAALHPAFVVIYPSPANYLDEQPPHAAVPDTDYHAAQPPIAQALYPRALGRLREQLKQVLPEPIKALIRARQTQSLIAAHPAGWRFNSVPADRLAQYERDLRTLIGTVRRVGAVPIIATHANQFMGRPALDGDALIAWEKFYPRATGPTIIAMDSLAREVTRRVAFDSSVVAVDAATVLAAAPVTAFADFVHFTDFGAGLMAGALSGGVLSAAEATGVCRPHGSSEGFR